MSQFFSFLFLLCILRMISFHHAAIIANVMVVKDYVMLSRLLKLRSKKIDFKKIITYPIKQRLSTSGPRTPGVREIFSGGPWELRNL